MADLETVHATIDHTGITGAGGMANPMTTAEDIIYGGASGAPTRKAKGSNGTFLGVAAGALGYAAVTDALLSTSDITTNNASTTKHGFAPKYPNDATKYLDGTGAYTVPAGGGGGGLTQSYQGYNTVGSSTSVPIAGRQIAQSFTLASDGYVLSIGIHVAAVAADVAEFAGVIWKNNAGAPSDVIAEGRAGPVVMHTGQPYRWYDMGMGMIWLPAGTYWAGPLCLSNASSSHSIHYDTGGSDPYADTGGAYAKDFAYGIADSTRHYSIRISTAV